MIVERKIYRVSELNNLIKDILDERFPLDVWVTGEIRDFKTHNGNWYFILRDEQAQVECVMWQTYNLNLPWRPQNGVAVEVLCKPTLYAKGGKFELLVKNILPAGKGKRAIEFEMLKEKLRAEGLFDPIHKKPLPQFPFVIGVVTSAKGAAVRDIIKVVRRRAPWTTIIVRHSLVQGDDAPADIIQGIKDFNEYGKVDLIIVGRGGGSEEDLWCFNDEGVARAIFASKIPIISAVGHEIDVTIADFVADRRAPTPSAAAEMAVPDKNELKAKLEQILRRVANLVHNKILMAKRRVDQLHHRAELRHPLRQLDEFRRQLEELRMRAENIVKLNLERAKKRVEHLSEKIKLLSVENTLSRGFSIVWRNGNIIKDSSTLVPNESVVIQFFKGKADAEIKKIKS